MHLFFVNQEAYGVLILFLMFTLQYIYELTIPCHCAQVVFILYFYFPSILNLVQLINYCTLNSVSCFLIYTRCFTRNIKFWMKVGVAEVFLFYRLNCSLFDVVVVIVAYLLLFLLLFVVIVAYLLRVVLFHWEDQSHIRLMRPFAGLPSKILRI